MLEIKHLVKIYEDGTQALNDINFKVDAGEFLVIIGLSGSGKSTLLRCINRLIEPTEGKIIWDGVDITSLDQNRLRQTRRQIGMIFQHFNLVKRSNVLTNVLSGRLGYVNPMKTLFYQFPSKDRQMAIDALKRVGILDQAYKRADELSGGQQQRVGVARALMQQPRMILADEPVASLDPVLAHNILGYLEKMNQEEGITVLCSLHYLDLVQRYASRVIGLRDGKIVYRGSKEDIVAMTDDQFREIYGEEAIRVSAGFQDKGKG
ncbi:MAG: phosphonate ABC transporter ATP-binding protein [Spirochaetota bacterium]|nr:MAG: phosphonate ABC transporter ATP-binding protein [Spirochaetota bacterium]